MRAMRRIVLASVLLAGCAGPLGAPAGTRAPDYRGTEIRRPAVTVHLAFGPGDFTKQERASLPEVYTGALLDALNAQAILPVDVTVADARVDRAAAAARARETGADEAVVVQATVARGLRTFCRDTRRPFTTGVTEWTARVDVLRAADGQVRLVEPEIRATDFAEDCDDAKSSRRLDSDEAVVEAARKAVAALLGH